MIHRKMHAKHTANPHPASPKRRTVLQGVAAAIVASAAPVVSAENIGGMPSTELSGKLVCNISDPVKTLVLRNHSNQTLVIDRLSKSALMFDGSIVDCNNAFVNKPVSIPAYQEVEIRFAKRHPRALFHAIEDYQRVQSRVSRLANGTRVIPFTANVQGSSAIFV